jgi:hypothetical protein
MRIKIIGENNCARATRHLLRLAGFAVTEFLPADAPAGSPLAGYAITIDLAPAHHTPDDRLGSPDSPADFGGTARLGPDPSAHHAHSADSEEASHWHSRSHRDASSPAFVPLHGTSAGGPAFVSHHGAATDRLDPDAPRDSSAKNPPGNDKSQSWVTHASIHFDSVESELEAAVLRHVTQLAAAPVILDRPGGVVRCDRELRIVAPQTGDTRADEAAAMAIEFGVLRGLLDLTAPAAQRRPRGVGWKSVMTDHAAEDSDGASESPQKAAKKWNWWPFAVLLLAALCGAGVSPAVLRLAAAAPAQGQFATGQGIKITDGTNFLAVDPCAGQPKSYASINQTANTQLVAGTASKKIYVCSIHVVVAAATNIAVVEGTGTACGTGTAGVSGFGGATAATGWNFAANGGIGLGSGESSLGAEGTSGDNLCIFTSGSAQVSGGISYVAQ